jgi:hypothetical protein
MFGGQAHQTQKDQPEDLDSGEFSRYIPPPALQERVNLIFNVFVDQPAKNAGLSPVPVHRKCITAAECQIQQPWKLDATNLRYES